MTQPETTADDVADLKSRRKTTTAARGAGPKPGTTALSQEVPKDPPATLSAAITRSSNKVLFAPGEHPPVIQNGGFVPNSTVSDIYTVAESDVSENFVPRNAKTPVSKMLWCKGSLVRNDIYAMWQKITGAVPDEVTEETTN